MPSERPFLSIIIPAYNEEYRIEATLRDVDRKLKAKPWSYEILVVDDGSKDNTAGVVRNLAREIKNLLLAGNKENQGKGGVVRQGMLMAKGRYRLFMDADNSVTVEQLDNLLPWFDKGYDIVIGSIEVPGAEIHEQAAWYRRLLGKLSKWIIHVVLQLSIHDTQRGFKCFKDIVVPPIFSRQTAMRWGFDFEILYLAKRLGFKVKEVPVVWVNPGESKVKLGGYLTSFEELLKVRWNSWTGKYR